MLVYRSYIFTQQVILNVLAYLKIKQAIPYYLNFSTQILTLIAVLILLTNPTIYFTEMHCFHKRCGSCCLITLHFWWALTTAWGKSYVHNILGRILLILDNWLSYSRRSTARIKLQTHKY